MADLYDSIKENIDQLIAEAKDKSADGMTAAEAWELFLDGKAAIVRLVERAGGTGAAKKEAAVKAAERFYAEVIAPIDLPSVPNVIEGVVDAAVGRMIRPIISATIDFLVKTFNETKVFLKAA